MTSAEERKRGIAVQLLLNRLDILKTKVDVLSEPFLEAKKSMTGFYEVVVPVLKDYGQLQAEIKSLREERALYIKRAEEAEEKLKKLQGKEPTKKKEKKGGE